MEKLFTLGPVEMYDEIKEIGGQQIPYFRTDEFSQVVKDTAAMLKKLAGADEKADVIFLTCSGTGGMEATIMNCFTPEDKLVVINGGSFGHRFCELCELHKIPFTPITLDKDEKLEQKQIDDVLKEGSFTGLLVNIDESSTGQLYDIKMLSDICKANRMVFVVDAISSFLADKLNMEELEIDALILSTQKALSLAPGMSPVIVSGRMIEERINKIDSGIMYLDFKEHMKNAVRGQTPYTPAVRIIYEMNKMLQMFCEKGIDNIVKETAEIAEDFRKKIKEIGLSYPDYPLSNAVTPVIFNNGEARFVYERLRYDYGMTVNPNGGDAATRLFRVAHIGRHSMADNDELINAIKEIMEKWNEQ